MKKFRMFRVFFLLFAVLFALSGCTGKTTVEQSGNAYTIYYLNTSGIQLVGSEYRTETTDLDALVRELLDFVRVEKHGYKMCRRISTVRERCRSGSKRSPTGSRGMFCIYMQMPTMR